MGRCIICLSQRNASFSYDLPLSQVEAPLFVRNSSRLMIRMPSSLTRSLKGALTTANYLNEPGTLLSLPYSFSPWRLKGILSMTGTKQRDVGLFRLSPREQTYVPVYIACSRSWSPLRFYLIYYL